MHRTHYRSMRRTNRQESPSIITNDKTRRMTKEEPRGITNISNTYKLGDGYWLPLNVCILSEHVLTIYIHSTVHDPPTTISKEETYI